MCFESFVSFEYFLCVKDLIWDTGIISNLSHTKNIQTKRNFRNTFGT